PLGGELVIRRLAVAAVGGAKVDRGDGQQGGQRHHCERTPACAPEDKVRNHRLPPEVDGLYAPSHGEAIQKSGGWFRSGFLTAHWSLTETDTPVSVTPLRKVSDPALAARHFGL